MFYTKLGRVAVGLAFVLGITGIVLGFSISSGEGVTADGIKLADIFIKGAVPDNT
jgi:hypothetical protein